MHLRRGSRNKTTARSRRIVVSLGLLAVMAAFGLLVGPAVGDVNSPADLKSQEASSVKSGGTLKIIVGLGALWQCTFNPFLTPPSYTPNSWGFIYEPLVIVNGLYKPGVPREHLWLASSYKWSNNNRTLTFTIRKDVKWSDSQRFTAADVVFTFDLIKKYPALDLAGAWQWLTSVRQAGAFSILEQTRKEYKFLWLYIHARDVARAYRLACEAPGLEHETLFIVANDALALEPTASLLERFYPDVPVRAPISEFGSLASNASAGKRLGFEPACSWRDDIPNDRILVLQEYDGPVL